MSNVPLDLQRKFEQRWAARFCRPTAVRQARIGLKARVTARRSRQIPKEKPAEAEPAGLRSLPMM
jgi:hypothetical protein